MDELISGVAIIGTIVVGAISSRIAAKFTDSTILGTIIAIAAALVWIYCMYRVFGKKADKAPETDKAPEKAKAAKEDPFAVLERIDKTEREKYPESVRGITLRDIRKKANEKHAEIYNSADSFDDEKELIDMAVKTFSSIDNFMNTPAYAAKAALKLIGYNEELVNPLYEMLYKEVARVYNVLTP